MAWYRAGTVSCTQNSSTVTGTNTAFTDNCRVGDAFLGPDGTWYEVTNVASQTALAITPAYRGATVSGGSFAVVPVQGYNKASADALRSATQAFVSSIDGIDDSLEAAQASASAAHTSEVSAHTSEVNAAGSEGAAASSASAAEGSATSAGGSATAAGKSATNAKTSESNAKTSETNAANSASAAAQSAQQTADKLSRAGGKMTGAIDWANFVAIASADTVDIGGAASNLVQLTGTTTINTFKAANAGAERRVIFTGVMTLVHSAKIILPGAAPITTAVGDWADFVCWDGTNWYCTQYQKNLNAPYLVTQSTTDSVANRLLKTGDFGLGSIVSPLPTVTSLNQLGVMGSYRLDSSFTGAPPILNAGAARQGDVVTVRAWNGGVVHQQYYTIEGDIWYRKVDVAGNTQTPWRKIYNQANVVGVVSQTSGVPTGAIVETGTNSNGTYTRWADGTQICAMNSPTLYPANGGNGSVFSSAVFTFTYPAAFITLPRVAPIALNPVNNICWGVLQGSNATVCGIYIVSPTSVGQAYPAYIAYGRWF